LNLIVGSRSSFGMLRGNPVRIRNCPAAVNRNERLDMALGWLIVWEAEPSRRCLWVRRPADCYQYRL